MDRKLFALALIAVGVAIVLVSALTDVIGIGGEGSAFGWKQVAGVVVGVALVVAGVVLRLRSPEQSAG